MRFRFHSAAPCRGISINLLACLILANPASAQTSVRIDPQQGGLGWLTHPYQARYVPPVNLSNSSRLGPLIRAGNLYLTARDVVALAIENNIDVEVQRYNPLLAREVLRRAQAGTFLRTVGAGVSAGPTSVSLTGVSLNPSGLASASVSGLSAGGGIVTQLGPTIPTLDPVFSFVGQYQHITSPQSNTIATGTTALVIDSHAYQAQYQQNFLPGTTLQVTYAQNYNKINSPFYAINPFTTGDLDLQVTQNLLYGFGSAVNGRNIRVQKNNLKVTDLQFRQQVITTVSAVLNLYWDLVSFAEDVAAREQEAKTAEELLENNRKQVELGSLAEIEVTRAESQLYAARQDLTISQTNLAQQETVLKNALSRSGIATTELADVHVVPLDHIVIPKADEGRPVNDLVAEALNNRVEIQSSRINIDSNQLNLVGIKNSLKPTLQAFAEVTNNALSGTLTSFAIEQGVVLPYYVGGDGNFLAQIARRNFPSYSAGFSLNIPLRNSEAQSDYVSSLLEIRQNELTLQKTINQVRVDVQNAVIGLQQARVRYDASVKARVLSQQTFDADQKKYGLGAATAFQVVQDQRDLAASQNSEGQATANYSHAQIALDQALGTTLDVNRISIAEAINGRVTSVPVHEAQPPATSAQGEAR